MVEFSIRYEGDLRCSAIHGPSGANLLTDAPADNMGKGETFSPTDLTATSLATCLLTTMDIAGRKNNLAIDFTGATARVAKHMTSTPPRRIARIEVDVTLPLPPDHPARAAVEKYGRNCPVALSLHPDVEQSVTFRWIG